MAEGLGRWVGENPEGIHPQVPIELALRCTLAAFGSSASPPPRRVLWLQAVNIR